MTRRKLLSWLLALTMCLSVFTVTAFAISEGTFGVEAVYASNTITVKATGVTEGHYYSLKIVDKGTTDYTSGLGQGATQAESTTLVFTLAGVNNFNRNAYDVRVVDITAETYKQVAFSAAAAPAAAGGGGGGGGAAAAANVTTTSATNGSVKVSDTAAKAGDKVTVTPTPSSGYEVDTLTVKDKSGATIEAAKNADGTYTFTMPAASKLPVTVEATFKKAETSPVTDTGFVDVASDAYYADPVKWAVAQGITNGKDAADTFKPNDVCTRAEAVTFLYRAAGSPDVALSSQFKDVADGAYYAKAVAWAVANGITNGKDAADTFCPTDTCSRAEIVTFLARYEKAAAGDASRFVDVSASDWFAGSVGWAVADGITNGKDAANTFKPADTCTRAEIVTFLYRDFVK